MVTGDCRSLLWVALIVSCCLTAGAQTDTFPRSGSLLGAFARHFPGPASRPNMVSLWRGILLVPFLSCRVQAVRFETLMDDDVAIEHEQQGDGQASTQKTVGQVLSESSSVCGSRRIHELMQVDEMGMRVTQWNKMIEIARQHIEEQTGLIERMQAEIDRLKAKAAEQSGKEKSQELPVTEMTKLITEAVASPERFGDLESANTAQCGAMKRSELRKLKLPVKIGAYRKSKEAFEKAVKQRFDVGDVRTDAGAVLGVCQDMFKLEDKSTSFCDDLCAAFADAAGKASDASVGLNVGPSSDSINQQVEQAMIEMKMAVASMRTCQAAKETIESFQEVIEPLEGNIRVARDKAEEARDSLDAAEDTVEQVEEKLAAQEEATSKAQVNAEAKSEEMKDAKKHLAEVKALEVLMRVVAKRTTKKLAMAKNSLTQFDEAEHAAQQLKLFLQKAMASMDLYFEMAVREPLRNMMLEESNWVSAFEDNDMIHGAKVNLKKSVQALYSYCEDTAKPAFASAEGSAEDLSKVCEFGQVDPTVEDMYQLLAKKKEDVMNKLKWATGWLNKFHGQEGMTEEKAAEYVQQGEPQGLREIIGSLKVQGYLYEWRKGGPFLDLMHKLSEKISQQAAISDDLQDSLETLTGKLKEMAKKRYDATESLKLAINSNNVAQNEKTEAEDLLASETMEAEQANNRYGDLEAAAEAAWKMYTEARNTLTDVFKRGVSKSLLQEAQQTQKTLM